MLLTKDSTPAVTSQPSAAITIAGTTIRQDDQGRYCLNDLHKASGGEARFKPANWLRTDQASELEAELSSSHIRELKQNQLVNAINSGNDRGTYVCKELVYAYAMWISAKFHLQVIRTFDAVVTGQLQPQGQHKLPQNYKEALQCLNLIIVVSCALGFITVE